MARRKATPTKQNEAKPRHKPRQLVLVSNPYGDLSYLDDETGEYITDEPTDSEWEVMQSDSKTTMRLLGLSGARVRQLIISGVLPHALGQGRYALKRTLHGYIHFLESGGVSMSGSPR